MTDWSVKYNRERRERQGGFRARKKATIREVKSRACRNALTILAGTLVLGACGRAHAPAPPSGTAVQPGAAAPAKAPRKSEKQRIREALASPLHRLSSYSFDRSAPLELRVGSCPAFVRDAYARMDEAPDYFLYEPTDDDVALVSGYIDGLPDRMKGVLRERLIGIYFIENLRGNGISEWVLDETGKVHVIVILNPAGLRKTLSQTLTERERTVFRGRLRVSVDCGDEHRGILYSILHELTHVFDYTRGITPFAESFLAKVQKKKVKGVKWDVWDGFCRPGKGMDFPLREKIRFYGFGGPLIHPGRAGELYAGLKSSPFASLYGSTCWSEDAAELFTFYHITQNLKQPYLITVASRKGWKARIEPMTSEVVLKRARRIAARLGDMGASSPPPAKE